ncbi:DUF2953 domain-containing protein [Paenibacillus alvei]|uniref:DUF2953 domain-containing protein n=1 Tax=Paenibacillus alvei TaxID=44250 RepID=UPI000288BFA2|nr:DUF2953 domain-containing protein [Paenibacillus alvei]EJW18090.1 hypothetical protein PAV_3c05400 [Paenibacillus alvei DSM 29]MCY9542142.1 DUF2953 domain-containing protein [Paenibacillus alvei]MCY9703586.1 DUF2953 domain-containing protein [Paenibacillus alvei]MCY9732467.1 DUF2953 domain-containing protein [Paenibacillus alvei]MCY9754475.1 DUF2953 domain-containing protein [Paenibacillus alvei]
MLGWAIAGGVVAVLLVFFFFSSIECKIIVHKSGKYERIVLLIRACYGLFRWRYEWRSIRFINLEEGFHVRVKAKDNVGTGNASRDKAQVDKRKAKRYVHNAQRFLHHTYELTQWLKQTLQRVQCSMFTWETEIGLLNPATACFLTGASWSLKSLLVGVMSHHVQFRSLPQLEVNPQFHCPFFSTRVVCITKIRIVHAISAVFKLIIRIVRAEGGLRTWRSILSRA